MAIHPTRNLLTRQGADSSGESVRHGVRVGAGFRSGSAWPRISSDARAFAGLVGSRRRAGRWRGRRAVEVAVRFMVLPTGFEPAARIYN